MPKCAVWSCKNSSNNIRIRDGISFFHYPRDPLLASQWWSVLAPVVADSFKPATAVVCSDHFHRDHKYMCKTRHRLTRNAVPHLLLLGPASAAPRRSAMQLQNDDLESSDDESNMIVDIPEILRPPSESTVCRVCLMTEGRMKRVTVDNYEDAYKQVTGIKWNTEDKLPQHLCWECGHRLESAAKFKRKAIAAHNLLKDIRSDQNFLTLNDIKLIDRNYHQLMSNLSQKHFPPNQYLSNTTINNNQIFSQTETELLKRLKNCDKNHDDETKSEAEKALTKDYVNLESTDKKLTDTNNGLDLKPNGDDFNSTEIYKELKQNGDEYKNLEKSDSLTDGYKNSNSNHDDPNLPYKNIKSDTYSNLNTTGDYLPTYKSLESTDTYKNLPDALTYNNLDSATYKSLDTKTDEKGDSAKNTEIEKVPNYKNPGKDLDNDMYDSDESDILVIDAGNEPNLSDKVTVIKSEYVGAGDGGMSIDELIDIYNNDGDGDERLQELNSRFGDEATVQIDQGWGSQRKSENNSRRDKNTQDTTTERFRPKASKPSAVLQTGNGIRSRAYDKLNRTLFTLTPVSEAEQIADIYKRQESFRFKRAPYKCYLCFRSFQARRAYDTHMLRHDASNGAFECTVCKARQKSPRAVKTHMYSQHTVKISCNDCSFVTMNRSVARSHEKWHAGTIYQCPHCPSQFDQESTYKSHLRTRHVHEFACALCGFTFVSRKGLAVHRCKRHADADQIPLLGPYCEACELRFMSEEAYTRHLKLSSRHRTDNAPSYSNGVNNGGN